jgi:hypothetical protein
MSEGLVAVQSRISQIQSLIGIRPDTGTSTSGSAFATALSDATMSGTTTQTGTGATGEAAVQIATKYLGVPYKWGGTDPDNGLDCSGLVQLVYKQLGVDLPRTSSAQSQQGTKVASLAQAQPGDLVFFGHPVHHVGIYIGGGKMLNAPHSGAKVRIEKVWGTPSQIRRVLPSSAAGTAPSLSSLGLSAINRMGAASTASASSGLTGTPYANLFTAAGKKYGVDPALLSAVAKAESNYRPNAVSGAGARGMMQLMPGTARELGVDPDVAAQAVDGAARLLSSHLRTFHGRVDLALAAYNAGAGAVRKYNGVPPYAETQNYVTKVTGYWGELR